MCSSPSAAAAARSNTVRAMAASWAWPSPSRRHDGHPPRHRLVGGTSPRLRLGSPIMKTAAEFTGSSRFEVVRRLGAGGMGVVYEAWDRQHDTRVAVKTL